MQAKRRPTRVIEVGNVKIGGDNPITIQSMCNTDTRDADATIAQIHALQKAGCEVVRVAVPDERAAGALKEIKRQISIPLVADIHFDYRLALTAMENGIDKLRINPGNIGSKDKVQSVVKVALEKNIPIRIGVNAGSLEKSLLEKHGGVTPEALVESALNHAAILEEYHFENIALSVKASSVPLCIEAYRLLSQKTDYPLHLGITEAGTVYGGTVKSAVGIGALLAQGIGDTIRVSLTGDPVEEIKCAKQILQALELRSFGVTFISCPTCGRTEVDLIGIANKVEEHCANIDKNIKVAVMGCVVNGPGEAREADIGVACNKDGGVIFKKGKALRKVSKENLLNELLHEINTM